MVTSVHAATLPDDPADFQHYWLAETVRLRESQWGPLQDNTETRQARAQGRNFSQRLLLRARLLGRREGIDTAIQQWTRGAKLAFFALAVLAILTGSATALGALGDGTRQVNLILALATLLGLHILTFVFWLISHGLPSGNAQTGLGEVWLWLTRRLARGPQAVLIPRALASMLARQGALRPLLGAVSHALWSCALTAMLATLVALLSARRYTFSWETTLLSPDTFVAFTKGLGWLPSKLGFSMPPDAMIRASDGLQTLPVNAHALWSGWLIGCLLCYGLLPRLLALAATAITTLRHIRTLAIDGGLPGYIELRDRLEPLSVAGGIDAPAPAATRPHSLAPHVGAITTRQAIVGLELAQDEPWPPAPLSPQIADLGVIDERPQRQRLLDILQVQPPQKLLIVCDGRQTPDRGAIALIHELAGMARQTSVFVLSGSGPVRRDTWNSHVQRAGLSANDIYFDQADALAWLSATSAHASGDNPP